MLLVKEVSSLWHPSNIPSNDIDNGYFLAKLQFIEDYNKVLTLPYIMCKERILEAVGGLVGKVAKLDFNTDKKTRGYFARIVVFVDLNRPLVSQVLANGELIRVKYEALPTICFSCGKYDHLKETCPSLTAETSLKTRITSDNLKPSNSTIGGKRSAFGPWMVVEWKIRWG
ncbi:hypothetical protein PVK06_011902 [Gossypium arboreum]|uniref:CCHC-type domain-containing protein n=1 Tax=Gossypium arboreum TaxID=29729 RepID=A0ABR0QAE1_GOSAR|nr:hypothetical protein PVK06_011902 [Gossypium arboreum]